MLVEIVDKNSNYSYVIKIYENLADKVAKVLPFTTKLNVWKEEVYFQTPIKLEGEAGTYRIRLGEVYYWPPGRAFCLFYGISEPYTPVMLIGNFVGPLYYLRYVSDGDEAEARIHNISNEYKELADALSEKGYDVASPLNGDVVALAGSKSIKEGLRLSFLVFKEPYGYHIETDAFFKYDFTYHTLRTVKRIKEEVALRAKYVRLDINEDGYVVLTAGIKRLSELLEAIDELEVNYPEVCTLLLQKI